MARVLRPRHCKAFVCCCQNLGVRSKKRECDVICLGSHSSKFPDGIQLRVVTSTSTLSLAPTSALRGRDEQIDLGRGGRISDGGQRPVCCVMWVHVTQHRMIKISGAFHCDIITSLFWVVWYRCYLRVYAHHSLCSHLPVLRGWAHNVIAVFLSSSTHIPCIEWYLTMPKPGG